MGTQGPGSMRNDTERMDKLALLFGQWKAAYRTWGAL